MLVEVLQIMRAVLRLGVERQLGSESSLDVHSILVVDQVQKAPILVELQSFEQGELPEREV